MMGSGRNDKGRGGLLVLALALMMFLTLNVCSEAAYKQQQLKNKQISSLSRLDSSAIFPIRGNVYPDGLFYVALYIGVPPKPYYLDIDSGSDLTWLQCDAPCVSCYKGPHPLYVPKKTKLIPCKDPLCTSLRTFSRHRCELSSEQCDYEIAYADQGSSLGVLVKDAITIRFANGSVLQPHLAFGCGYDQQDLSVTSPLPTDGVLGLGYGKSSIVSQLQVMGLTRNVVGHCLSRKGDGYLFFGDGFVPFSSVTWTPMIRNKYYSPGPANLLYGYKATVVKNLPVVFDSGSTYTYFASSAYQQLISTMKKELAGKSLTEARDKNLPLCWKGTIKFKSFTDVKKFFNPLPLVLIFGKGAQLEIPLERYLIITSNGNVCLGILNGTEARLENLNVIGDISLQDLMVIYDNEQQQIGWISTDCNRLPKSGTALL